MPDLLTHALFAYPSKKIFPEKLVFILIGSVLPDLLGRVLGVFISNSSFVYWCQLAIHTPLSLLLFTYSLSFFFPEKERKTIFIFILIGVFSHFFLDLFQKTITVGNLWFFPFSFASPQIHLIWPDETIFLIPGLLVINILAHFFLIIKSMQKNTIKVTLFGTLPPIKGISGYCIEQASCLSKKIAVEFINFKFIYPEFLYHGGTKEFDHEFTIKASKQLAIKNILTWYNPFSWLKAGLTLRGHIVHINWWTYYLFPVFFTILIFAKLRRKKIIVTVHNVVSHESGKIDTFCSKIIYGLADHLIVHSSGNKESLVQKFKINKAKITEIPYGVLNIYNRKKITNQQARKYFNLNKNQKVVLYFGTIRKYKGIDILIKAFSEVKRKVKNAKLLIAGQCWSDWSMYDKLIKSLNLDRYVLAKTKFIPTSEVKYFFTAADLLVLPYSYFESQTAVGILGLTFNKAMVVTRVGGLPELIKNKNCVVEPNNPKELAKAIVNILKNEKLQKRLEKDSRNLARKYLWKNIAKKILNIYEYSK